MNVRRKAEVQKGCISFPVQEPDLGKVTGGEIAVKQQDANSKERSDFKMSGLTRRCGHN